MSDSATLKADIRQEVGTRVTGKLREQGKLPAVVYGHKKDSVSISLNTHDFLKGLHHGHRIFEVDIAGTSETLLVKELQYDYLGKDVIHADLMRVNLNEIVEVQVPIEMIGSAKGLHEGGIVDEQLDHLIIKCKVRAIPDTIQVNVKDLGLGDVLHAGQVELGEGFELVTDPEAVLLTCHEAKAAISAEAEGEGGEGEGGAAEPEVITEKKEEGSAE